MTKRKLFARSTGATQGAAARLFGVLPALLTDAGCVRSINEDSGQVYAPENPALIAAKGVLVVVADGMGGCEAGEVASRVAVELVGPAYYEGPSDPGESLEAALQQANSRIHALAGQNSKWKGMGTTCTALALQGNGAYLAHVGDTRLYLVRDGQIYRLTEDHSQVMDMVRRGLLSQEEARGHQDRSLILRALGRPGAIQVSVWPRPLPIRAADRFVLCTDGLHELATDTEIRDLALAAAPAAACRALIDLARARGGYDNVTVAVVAITDGGSPA